MAAQVRELVVAWREAAVVIETRFTHGDNRGIARKLCDFREIALTLARDVRMDAHAGVETEFGTKLECGARRRKIPARDEHALDASVACRADDRFPIALERL